MEDVAELVKQVQILHQTVEAQTLRNEQLYKMQTEVLSNSRASITEMREQIGQAVLELQAIRDQQQTINEAQQGALSDLDGITDDLANVTKALLQVQKQLNPSNREVSSQTA